MTSVAEGCWQLCENSEKHLWISDAELCDDRSVQIGEMLSAAPVDACFIDTFHRCRQRREVRGVRVVLMSCRAETARKVLTLPYFSRVRVLHLPQVSPSLSACSALLHVCLAPETCTRSFIQSCCMVTRLATNGAAQQLQAETHEMTSSVRELLLLQSLHVGEVWDPSEIVNRCSKSLASFRCASCAVLRKPMPHLERFACDQQCAYFESADVSAALAVRDSKALQHVFISRLWLHQSRLLIDYLTMLPKLEVGTVQFLYDAPNELGSRAELGAGLRDCHVVQSFPYETTKFAVTQVHVLPKVVFLIRMRELRVHVRAGSLEWLVRVAPGLIFKEVVRQLTNTLESKHTCAACCL